MVLKRITAFLGLLLVLVLGAAAPGQTWGPRAHLLLNRYALQNLPPPLQAAMSARADVVVEMANAADARKSTVAGEAERHFIDLDRYGPYPFADVPRELNVLIQRYGAERVRANGLLPWALVDTTERLAAQMRARDPALWQTAADLGHYAADANMPLHTTENYNGQKTGNTGAHALFEEVLVDAFWRDSLFVPRAARAPNDLLASAFETIVASHGRIAPLLAAMTRAQERYARTDPRFYALIWAEAGPTMVASINQAAFDIASFWLAAWERAGRPDLQGVR
jgi:hypothetical protein